MTKLLQRLSELERKIDALAGQALKGPAVPAEPKIHARTLYEAVCADCHKVCEVPFKPSEDRAVYCKECFARRKAGQSNPGMPKLTPVAMPPKPAAKPIRIPSALTPAPAASSAPVKRTSSAKKSKKKTKK